MDARRRAAEREARFSEAGEVRTLVERLRTEEWASVHCPKCHGTGTINLEELVEDGGKIDFDEAGHEWWTGPWQDVPAPMQPKVKITVGPKGLACRRCGGAGKRKLREVIEVLAWAGDRVSRLALGLTARWVPHEEWIAGFARFEHDVPMIVELRTTDLVDQLFESGDREIEIAVECEATKRGQGRKDVLAFLVSWAYPLSGNCACGAFLSERSSMLEKR
jgi:hypothetical protein